MEDWLRNRVAGMGCWGAAYAAGTHPKPTKTTNSHT